MSKSNLSLALLLGGHVLLGLLFNVTTPIFEAPDEDGHYLFVRYLQVHGELPVQQLDPYGPRAHHPPLYHLLGALLTSGVPVRGGAERIDAQVNPHVWFRYDDPERDNKNMWVHYGPEERFPYSGQARVIHAVRLLSLAFSTLGVLFTFLAARRLRPASLALPVLAGGLVAFHPMVLFMSGVLQNNTTMLAAGGAVVYVLTVFVERGFTPRRWALLGVLLGLSALLHLSSLTLAAPIGVALLYETWRTRRLSTLIVGTLAIAVPFGLLSGWWFLRNQALYRDWTGNNVVAQMWCCDPIQPLPALKLFLTGLLGRFGQGLMITYPAWVYSLAALLGLVAIAGLLRPDLAGTRAALAVPIPLPRLPARRTSIGRVSGLRQESWLAPRAAGWLIHAATVLGVGGAVLFYALTVTPGVPGRYLFPAFPALACGLAAGWLAWFRPRRQAAGVVFLPGLLLAATLYALFGLLRPTYAMPRTASAAEIGTSTPLQARIGEAAEVLAYRVNTTRLRPGEALEVSLYWRPLSRTAIPYTVFLHLFAPGLGSLAQRDTYPGLGNYATTVWDVGRPFVDVYRVKLPPDTPAVEGAMLLLGLYDGTTGERLPVTGANAGPEHERWVQFGNISVTP